MVGIYWSDHKPTAGRLPPLSPAADPTAEEPPWARGGRELWRGSGWVWNRVLSWSLGEGAGRATCGYLCCVAIREHSGTGAGELTTVVRRRKGSLEQQGPRKMVPRNLRRDEVRGEPVTAALCHAAGGYGDETRDVLETSQGSVHKRLL